jgi:hypothetical protein
MDQKDYVPLRDYVDRIFEEKEKALNVAFKGQQEALSLASAALNKELEHLNELRQEVTTARGWVIGFGAAAGMLAGGMIALILKAIAP